jgi:hypothetical protein
MTDTVEAVFKDTILAKGVALKVGIDRLALIIERGEEPERSMARFAIDILEDLLRSNDELFFEFKKMWSSGESNAWGAI